MSDDADEEDLTIEVDLGSGGEDAPGAEGEGQADDAAPDADGEDDAPEAEADAEDDAGPRRPASMPRVRDDPTTDDGDAGTGDASGGAPVEADPGAVADEGADDADESADDADEGADDADGEPADATVAATADADGREAETDGDAAERPADTDATAGAAAGSDVDDGAEQADAAEPEPTTNAGTETDADSGPDPETTAEVDAGAETDADDETGTEVDPEVDPDRDSEVDAPAATDADAETDAEPEVGADPESDASDEVAAEAEPEAETDSGVGPDADAEPGADAGTAADADAGTAPDADTEPEADVDPESPQGRMERALTAVRREGQKAAAIYAVADGVAAMLAVNVVLATVASAVPYPTVLAVLAGVAVLGGEFWLRTRRSLVERFEAANPETAGPLRTARDAVESGADNRMAARLYEETLERLRDASGVALVNSARVAATGVVVVVLCLASLQVSVVGLSFLGDDTTTAVDDRPEAVTPEPDGLRDGGAVLGDPDPVDRGSDDVTAEVEANEGDGPIEEDRSFPSDGGGAGGADVETRQAAFSRPDRVEDAELVREYNLRIREQE